MTDPAALQKLMTWLSPAFPVGAFAWSSGLETAIVERRVTDATSLEDWIGGALAHGGARTDAILLAHAWRVPGGAAPAPPSPPVGEGPRVGDGSDDNRTTPTPNPSPQGGGEPDCEATTGAPGSVATLTTLTSLSDLCLALAPSAERTKDLVQTGDAFVTAARAWPSAVYDRLPGPCPYPVAVGAIAAAHGIGLGDTLLAYLMAAVHGQVSVAVRLVPLGQTDGLAVVAALEPAVAALAAAAATASLDEIGGIAYAADIAQMRHEVLKPRVFRS